MPALTACRDAFGDAVAPLYLPVGAPVDGLIGLLSQKLFSYAGGNRSEGAPTDADADRMEELRGELIEGIIQESEDEGLMDRYLSGEDIDPKVLIEDLEKAVARGSFYPVLVVVRAAADRHARAARGDDRGLPLTCGAPAARRDHPGRQARQRAVI